MPAHVSGSGVTSSSSEKSATTPLSEISSPACWALAFWDMSAPKASASTPTAASTAALRKRVMLEPASLLTAPTAGRLSLRSLAYSLTYPTRAHQQPFRRNTLPKARRTAFLVCDSSPGCRVFSDQLSSEEERGDGCRGS